MKAYLKNYCLTAVSIFVLPALFIWFVDPFQFFHRPFLREPLFSTNQRFQKAGLIRTYLPDSTYNAIVVGSSLSENYRKEVVDKSLGWDSLDLTIKGIRPTEAYEVVSAALRVGKIRHVLWELGEAYASKKIQLEEEPEVFPSYAYQGNLLGMHQYLFNWSLLPISGEVLYHRDEQKWVTSHEETNHWMMTVYNNGSFSSWSSPENINKISKKIVSARESGAGLESSKPYIAGGLQKLLFSLVKSNPQVSFKLVFPPYSAAFYASKTKENYYPHLKLRRLAVEMASKYSNVEVHGFDNEAWITQNIFNYKDLEHFSEAIGDQLLKRVASGENQINPQNIDRYLMQFAESINRYDINRSMRASFNPVFTKKNQIKNGVFFDDKTRLLGVLNRCVPGLAVPVTLQASKATEVPGCKETFETQLSQWYPEARSHQLCSAVLHVPKCYEKAQVNRTLRTYVGPAT